MTAVVDGYVPECENADDVFGYRDDPAPGLVYWIMHCEYEGDVGETLLFRLVSPDRLRELVVETDWEAAAAIGGANEGTEQWRAALSKV